MNTSNLSYTQAEAAMSAGQFVALPEWGGMWFKMPDGTKALTLPSVVAKAHTSETAYTTREDWRIVEGLLSFSSALTVLTAGYAVRLAHWSPEEYIFIRPADILDRSIMGVVKSLPGMVKALLYREHKSVTFSQYFCKAQGNMIQAGWLPSAEELLATNWVLAANVR
jgi:hypothetical protein